MNDTWVKRCCICGDYAHGHGQLPDFPEYWVCGMCTVEDELWSVPMGEHVVLDHRVYGRACHYVVVDLDIDREYS